MTEITDFLQDAVKTGRLPAPRGASGAGWLAFCRRRIAVLMGQTVGSADA